MKRFTTLLKGIFSLLKMTFYLICEILDIGIGTMFFWCKPISEALYKDAIKCLARLGKIGRNEIGIGDKVDEIYDQNGLYEVKDWE